MRMQHFQHEVSKNYVFYQFGYETALNRSIWAKKPFIRICRSSQTWLVSYIMKFLDLKNGCKISKTQYTHQVTKQKNHQFRHEMALDGSDWAMNPVFCISQAPRTRLAMSLGLGTREMIGNKSKQLWENSRATSPEALFEGVCVKYHNPGPRRGKPRVGSAPHVAFPVDPVDRSRTGPELREAHFD